MYRFIELKRRFLVRAGFSFFMLLIIGRYVNLICIEYTSKNMNKSVTSNGTIRKMIRYEGETI